jgi:methanogenic corrinoid protein MtbC1
VNADTRDVVLSDAVKDARIDRPTRDSFLGALLSGDREQCLSISSGLVGRGVGAGALVRDLYAPAQIAIGQMWQQGQVSVAEEHVATSITEDCMMQVLSPLAGGDQVGRILLTGAEGDGHTLAVRMVSQVWRALGWDVVTISPTLPADDLAMTAHGDAAGIAGVSCSMSSNLVGAWHTISALRVAGLRVVAGGRAFDEDPALALLLGADAYVADAVEAGDLVNGWLPQLDRDPREPALATELPEVDRVWSAIPRIVEDALLLAHDLGPVDAEADVLREDLALVARSATSAALVDDSRIFAEHLDWYREGAVARGMDAGVADILAAAVDRMLPAGSTAVRRSMAAAFSR